MANNLWGAIMIGIQSFSKAYFNPQDETNWSSWTARQSRYAVYRALYDSTSYDEVHSFSHNLKYEYGLYRGVRNLGSPTALIAATYKDNVWGGVLDQGANDVGAIPIYTNNDSLRPYLADIFKWSQFARRKNLLTLIGTVCGEVGLEIVDELDRVYLKIIEPELVKSIELDSFGNVRAYVLEYAREHPTHKGQMVTYTKKVMNEGNGSIKFETFLDTKPFAWPENIGPNGDAVDSWVEIYGFCPFVWFRHIDNGSQYGESEYQAGLSRFREIDDITSRLGDMIRMTVEPVWVAKGVKPNDISFPRTAKTSTLPRPEGEELKLMCLSSSDAEIEALVAKLDMEGTLAHIDKLVTFLEQIYPEIVVARLRTEGSTVSGRALRIAQMPVETRVIDRRLGYDNGLKNALQMGLSVGGYRSLYAGINLNSYERGALDFEISDRPVFPVEDSDMADIDKKFFEAMKMAVESGISVRGYLRNKGWTEEQISVILEEGV